MSKTLLTLMNQRKQKTRIALCIRLSALCAIATFYLISTVIIDREDRETVRGK